MNFAPYQDDSPETVRVASPPPPHSPRKPAPTNRPFSPTQQVRLPNPSDFENNAGIEGRTAEGAGGSAGFGNGVGADERNVDVYSNSLPLRLDVEACLAYLALPPLAGAVLLMFEHKNDYVRFHAWQSSLVFGLLFIVHLIFSFSKVISFMLLAIDLILIAFMSLRAYRDVDTLVRFELPYFGRLASGFVDEE